jgi:hypothetical protein
MDRKDKATFRRECNRRRSNDWTIRGFTRGYADELSSLGCIFDPVDIVWLAPSASVTAQVSQWPDIVIGTPGPRIKDGYYKGFAALDLPIGAAQELLQRIDSDDPGLLRYSLQCRVRHRNRAYQVYMEAWTKWKRSKENGSASQ